MIIPAGAAQVNLKFTGSATPNGAQMTFGVAATEISNVNTIAVKIHEALDESSFMGNVSSTTAITSILVKMGPNETGPMYELGVSVPGEVGSTAVPPNVSVLIRKTTNQGGRKGQGRFFLPALPENSVNEAGIITPAFVSDINTCMAAFLANLVGESMPMVLLHSTDGPNTLPLAVQSLVCQSKVATQRRRLR